MTAKEAYEDVLDYCGKLETEWERREMNIMAKGVMRGIRLVEMGVQQKLDNLPKEEKENVQS